MTKKYEVKEIFGPTIEGEGKFAGYKCLFLRLSNCNIWNGDPKTKSRSMCPYCDTDFVGGSEMTGDEIVQRLAGLCPPEKIGLVNITGGEPLIQDIESLCSEIISAGYVVNIETNGTIPVSKTFSEMKGCSITCSPKVPERNVKLDPDDIDCLKVLFPHPSRRIHPEDFNGYDCEKFIQPIERDGKFNFDECLEKIFTLPRDWKMSIQVQKVIGVE
jgi:organic radical activating enzyme